MCNQMDLTESKAVLCGARTKAYSVLGNSQVVVVFSGVSLSQVFVLPVEMGRSLLISHR